jgi:hypothetical protein
MNSTHPSPTIRISQEEYRLIQQLRDRKPAQNPPTAPFKLGDRIADRVASIIGFKIACIRTFSPIFQESLGNLT